MGELALVFLANDMLDEIHMVLVNDGEAFDVPNEVESGDEEATRDCAAAVYVEVLVVGAIDLVVATEVALGHLKALVGPVEVEVIYLKRARVLAVMVFLAMVVLLGVVVLWAVEVLLVVVDRFLEVVHLKTEGFLAVVVFLTVVVLLVVVVLLAEMER